MVCNPPDPRKDNPSPCPHPGQQGRERHVERAIEVLFQIGKTSSVSGHYRKCTSDLSGDTFRGLIATVFSHVIGFHIENTATDDDCTYVYYQFDTRPGDNVCDHGNRGVDWGESDAEIAESLFKEWLGALYPGWVPAPLNQNDISIGQHALEQDYGLVYWIRDNIFVKLDIDDGKITTNLVHKLAKAIDDHLKAGSVMVSYDESE
ncbi:hypothetical protein ABW20_dc0109302 [Dactylellina cionopaga]|nr:hypothetical protein ABW20_dc0109302 [Dactylellina cionopaga]